MSLLDSRFYLERARDQRTPAQRDRDRILYCGAFARLAEITQVVSPERGYVFHNRLTHSLKVAQIARRIAEHLLREQPMQAKALGIDADSAEAAGLAHDLGHPPFGHIAEDELNRLVKNAGVPDGYEGNAQAFRIVTSLASSDARTDDRDEPIPGLNLTRRTLDAIIKYPWRYDDAPDEYRGAKWGYYTTEQDVFVWVREGRTAQQRSAIAEIMDWADDITFAIHDLLDFFCAGRIPIDRCKGETSNERKRLIQGMFKRKPKWKEHEGKYVEALDFVVDEFRFEPDERYTDSREDRAKIYDFSTALISHFVASITIGEEHSPSAKSMKVESEASRAVEVLKQFIWEYVIENPDLAVPQSGQRAAIRVVFRRLLYGGAHNQFFLFPSGFQSIIAMAQNKTERVRIVADCIASMTEKEVIHLYRSLRGLSS